MNERPNVSIYSGSNAMRRHRLASKVGLVLLVAFFYLSLTASAAGPDNPRLVVTFYPDGDDGRPANLLIDQTIRSTFAARFPGRIEVHNEYLDVTRFRDSDYQQHLADFLRHKYAGQKIDVVVACLASVLDFAVAHREEIFPRVPIVFLAVDGREITARKLPSDVIGTAARVDFAGTLDLARRLHPDVKHVFVIAGRAKLDGYWEAQARKAFGPYEDKLDFVFLSGMPINELMERSAHLPERSIIYYLHVSQDETGRSLTPASVLEQLAHAANAPIYGHVDTFVGHGLTGGRVLSFENEAKGAATFTLRLLAGEKPEKIGVHEAGANPEIFDWRQLRRWNISEASLPLGSVVRFKVPTFWDLYRWHTIGVISLCVIEALLIAGLLVQRSNRRRAEKRFQQVVEAAPNGMVVLDQNYKIVLANMQIEHLFGYRKVELVGKAFETLVPDRFAVQDLANHGVSFASPDVRPISLGRELFGRRRDGTEFPIEIGLSSIQTDTELLILATVLDIAERKRSEEEIRESEARFRLMADAAPVLIWASGTDKGCTYFNRPWLDFTGRTLERELGSGWTEGVHTDDLPQCLEAYSTHFDSRRTFEIEYRLRRHDGEFRWVLDRGVPRLTPDGEFGGYIGACADVTDRRSAEESLRRSQHELRVLTAKLLNSQEMERRRIARELHDDVNQNLALLSVELDILGQKPDTSAPELRGQLQAISAKVKQLSSSVHGLSHELHPSKLEQLGLVATVRGLCKELTDKHGLPIDFVQQEMPERLSDDAALCLYRIVQEALGNAIKHSGAQYVRAELTGSDDAIFLRIADDGAGFDLRSVRNGEGLGLVSMRERLHLVGGTITINSETPGGTRIEVRVPRSGTAGPRTR